MKIKSRFIIKDDIHLYKLLCKNRNKILKHLLPLLNETEINNLIVHLEEVPANHGFNFIKIYNINELCLHISVESDFNNNPENYHMYFDNKIYYTVI